MARRALEISITTQPEREAYPAHREADVVLRDGSTVRVRPVHPRDEQALLGFYRGLSEQARALRFFTRTSDVALVRHVRRMVEVDDLPQIAELDCNPIPVQERGASIVDVSVRVTPVEPPRPLGARR